MPNQFLLEDGKETIHRVAALLSEVDDWQRTASVVAELNRNTPERQAFIREMNHWGIILVNKLSQLKLECGIEDEDDQED